MTEQTTGYQPKGEAVSSGPPIGGSSARRLEDAAAPFPDRLTIRRVANGWIIQPGAGADEYTHIAATPDDLAKHVSLWAKAQLI